MRPPQLTRERAALALLLLLVLAGLKLSFTPGMGHGSTDGNYYYQIARHVAAGDGLMTSVSLYHQGLKELPHPTNQNPAWPLLLGSVGRAIGLPLAASLLPKLLYVLGLVLIYFVANRIAYELQGGEEPAFVLPGGRVIDFGHLAMLLFGLDRIYFHFTSLPYTEAFAFVLLWAALLLTVGAMDRRSLAWGLAAGGVGALAFLTRSQFVGVPLIVLGGLVAWTLTSRASWRPLIGAASSALALVVAWMIFLLSWADSFSWRMMLGLAAYRETPDLESYSFRVAADSWTEVWGSRLSGLLTAFHPAHEDSYLSHLGGVALLVPIALVVVLLDRSQTVKPRVKGAFVEQPMTWMAIGSGLLMLGPLHTMHFRFFREWLFGWRHGLPLITLILVAVPTLMLGSRRAVRWLAGALVMTSVFTGSLWVGRVLANESDPGLLESERNLVAYLESKPPGTAVSVTSLPQTLGAFSDSGFHWIQCDEPGSQTLTLLEQTSAEFVIAYPGEQRCRFIRDIAERLELERVFGEESGLVIHLYRRRPAIR